MFGDCAVDISDQTCWCCNYQQPVAVGAVAACRQAVAIRCERGITETTDKAMENKIKLSITFLLALVVVRMDSWNISYITLT